jgi:hypothetical protein
MRVELAVCAAWLLSSTDYYKLLCLEPEVEKFLELGNFVTITTSGELYICNM